MGVDREMSREALMARIAELEATVESLQRQLALLAPGVDSLEFSRQQNRPVIHDPLTGLLNRQALYSQLMDTLEAARESHQFLTVLIIDIDHFKKINEYHGHQTADLVLAQLAAILQKCTRTSDLVARLDGDRFLIGLIQCDLARGQRIADRIRYEVSRAHFPKAIPVTVSSGLAEFANQSIDELINLAEVKLYVARQMGHSLPRFH